MNGYKKIALRILLMVFILLISNYIYKYYFFEGDLQKNSQIINLVRNLPQEAEVVYLGESSNITFRKDDMDKSPISAFLADFYPELKISDITKPAAHAGIYLTLLRNIPNDSKIKTVVVTLNLRSFNAQWIYSDLETSLQKSMVLLQPYPPLINRFLLSFKAYDIKTKAERSQQIEKMWQKDKFHLPFDFAFHDVAEWDYFTFNEIGIRNPDSSRNQVLTELACHYIKGYAFQIDTLANPRIRDFDAIVKLAKKRGWNLVFNLMAENYQKAAELVGKDLLFFMEENRKLLTQYYKRNGVVVVDNLYAVDDEQFVDQNWTTEHYAENGRKTIAKNLALKLKQFYPDNFNEAEWNRGSTDHYFNSCEGNIIWGQMQTLSEEQAFSGKKSSKTGQGQDFSITFEYPFDRIADSLKNEISLSCKIFQTSKNHEAKLVFQAEGDSVDYFWKGIAIQNQVDSVNRWQDFKYHLKVSEKLKKADLIKIYLFNPSAEVIYVDDMGIEFR